MLLQQSSEVWLGRMPDASWEAGGIWIIGDRQPHDHPGNTTALFYKSFVARPDRYGGDEYAFKNRIAENKWEFVQVFGGCLECLLQKDGKPTRFSFEYPGTADIAPEVMRRWRLPKHHNYAYGTTVLRSVPNWPAYAGEGTNYELQLWHDQRMQPLVQPLNDDTWRIRFVEVFAGKIDCLVDGTTYVLTERDHIFIGAGKPVDWRPRSRSVRGTIILFK